MRKTLALVLALTMVLALLAGCGDSDSGAQPADSGTGDTASAGDGDAAPSDSSDQTFTFFMSGTISGLDISDAKTTFDFQVLSQTQEGLVRLFTDENGNDYYEPAGATSWEVSDDGLTWTFHLREHNWSDGVQVTAQQYVDSIHRLLDPEEAFTYGFYAWDIKNGEAYYNGDCPIEDVGVNAIDDLTLEIVLEAAAPQFEKKIGFVPMFPIRMDLLEANREVWTLDPSVHAYNGPFVISEYITENSFTLTKNPEYWDADNVQLEQVNILIVEEFSTMAQLFESKEADIIEGYQEYTNSWIARAEAGEFQFYEGFYPALWWINFNQRSGGLSGLMNSPKCRLALSLALDRDEFVDMVYGRHRAAYSLVPFGMHVGEVDFRETYPEPLRELAESYTDEDLQNLFKEGMADLGDTRDISDVELVFINTGTTTADKAAQEFWQQSWENKLGLKIDLQVFGDRTLYTATRNEDQYDVSSGGMWHADFDDPISFLDLWLSYSSWTNMFGSYNSPAFDGLFDQLTGETDFNKRAEIYAEMERILILEEAGMSPVYFEDSQFFIHNHVKNLSIPQYGASFEFSRAYISGK